ncbi:MAG: hypothetical protein Q8M74_06695, partial [Chloroflexota bacterium]|nr:hypothetical protein [Chloroflexota bacterium]
MSFADIATCAGLTFQPTPRPGLHRITGQITMDVTERGGNYAHAVFELVTLEDEGGSRVFGPGSKGKVDRTLADPRGGARVRPGRLNARKPATTTGPIRSRSPRAPASMPR